MGRSYRSDEFSVRGRGAKALARIIREMSVNSIVPGGEAWPVSPGRWYNHAVKNPTLLLFVFLSWPAFQAPAAEPERVDFARDVRPILERSCWKCHGPEKQKGGLRLDLRAAALGPGDSGGGRSRPARPTRASSSGASRRRMPRSGCRRSPTRSAATRSRILRAWIDQGADWPETAAAASGRRGDGGHRRGSAALVLSPARPRRSPGGPRCGLVPHPDRPVRPRRPRGARHPPECPGRPAHPDPPGLFRPARPAPVARGGRGVRRGPGTRRLREAGRPPPRQPALRRALGPALARRRPLCRQRRAGVRRRPADRVPLPRLRDPGAERRHAVPDIRPLADRGRRIRARQPAAHWRPPASWRPRRPRC